MRNFVALLQNVAYKHKKLNEVVAEYKKATLLASGGKGTSIWDVEASTLGFTIVVVFLDDVVSGASHPMNRKGFKQAIAWCRENSEVDALPHGAEEPEQLPRPRASRQPLDNLKYRGNFRRIL